MANLNECHPAGISLLMTIFENENLEQSAGIEASLTPKL